ncbi:hypothetical protein [Nocardioides terrisoli]|uniref:hypothetical protein n=1 Tax=Nocardioides terrisoli TaxID=3388267 RepID=UPI00287B71DF|nr:hypothetical protein [Nocardioides marmorisolisilvae]
MSLGLAAAIVAALLYGAPAALQAHASRRLPEGPWLRMLRAGLADRLMYVVAGLYGLGALAQYVSIQQLPLYLAQAAVAGSLIFTALASAWYLHEWPSAPEWTALSVVCIGLGLLALGAGGVGGHRADHGLLPAMYAGGVAIAVLGVLARKLSGTVGSAVLGTLGGTAYAGVPIGARVLVAPYLRWQTIAVLGAISIFGILGFVLYSLALQRGVVNASTAPMILTQTTLPAVIGVALFHDGIRAGWGWIVVLGLALSMTGTVAVSVVAPPLEDLTPERVDQ